VLDIVSVSGPPCFKGCAHDNKIWACDLIKSGNQTSEALSEDKVACE
jgi:hypothetical protein